MGSYNSSSNYSKKSFKTLYFTPILFSLEKYYKQIKDHRILKKRKSIKCMASHNS